MKKSKILALVTLAVCLSCSPLMAQSWARKMFETTEHDFGSVAKNSKTEFEFKLENIFIPDVHVAAVRSSCGCTTPRITKHALKTYEEGSILAHFNTNTFTGQKGATLTVTFDKPYRATVQLHVRGTIRDDVVITPGSVRFGSVHQGAALVQTVRISSPRRGGLRITGLRTTSPYLSAHVTAGESAWGAAGYQLHVRLDERAPAGCIHDYVALATNDSRLKEVPVLVEGRIVPSVAVSPHTLFLGSVEPGQKVRKTLVVQGSQPLVITSVTSNNAGFRFAAPTADTPNRHHVIQAEFTVPEGIDALCQAVRIETDHGAGVVQLYAVMTVAEN
ncbi:DUF1573 domain-containing protein [bacterium]|nr:DUF1573 domain-containing protein [bacterium]